METKFIFKEATVIGYEGSRRNIFVPKEIKSMGKDAVLPKYPSPCIVYCESLAKPDGWDDEWTCDDNVVYWGINESNFLEQDGIIYVVKDGKAMVTGHIDDYCRHKVGDIRIVIPPTIEINGKLFKVTSIGDHAFNMCWDLKSIELPSTLESIGEKAFYSTINLNNIRIPKKVKKIGKRAFCLWDSEVDRMIIFCEAMSKPRGWSKNWKYEKYVYWGINDDNYLEQDGLIYLVKDGNAFVAGRTYDLDLDKKLIIPSNIVIKGKTYSVTAIGEYALYMRDSESLQAISLPNSIECINRFAFYGNHDLSEINIPDTVKTIKSWAFGFCYALTSIDLSKNIEHIGMEAFVFCQSLKKIRIPKSVKYIGQCTFSDCCSLTSIIIPNSVTNIKAGAFSDCSSLTIYCEASSKPDEWEENWNYSNRPVYWAGQWHYVNGVPTPNL